MEKELFLYASELQLKQCVVKDVPYEKGAVVILESTVVVQIEILKTI